MKKINFLITMLVFMLLTSAQSRKHDYLRSTSFETRFDDGFNDGFNEGQYLRSLPDVDRYNQFRYSYNTYASRFPNAPASSIEYFEGKYLGIVEGWNTYNPPLDGPRDTPEPPCYLDANGIKICFSEAFED